MNQTNADVDRLTREDIIPYIENAKARIRLNMGEDVESVERRNAAIHDLRVHELALKAFNLDRDCDRAYVNGLQAGFDLGYRNDRVRFDMAVEAYGRELRALKRELNAAAWDRSTERASGERTSAGTSPSPAPAAPDVAELERFRCDTVRIPGKPEIACGVMTQSEIGRWVRYDKAAALLAKLGQGWMVAYKR